MRYRLLVGCGLALACAVPALAQKAGDRYNTRTMTTTNEAGDPIVEAPAVTMDMESSLMSKPSAFDKSEAPSDMTKSFDAGPALGFDQSYDVGDAEIVMPVSSLGGESFAVPTFRLPESGAADRLAKSSSLNLRDSPLSSKRAYGFDRTFETHEYVGPEKDRVAKDTRQVTSVLSSLESLPDRNLTMGEVKQLLNQYTTGSSTREPIAAPVAQPVE